MQTCKCVGNETDDGSLSSCYEFNIILYNSSRKLKCAYTETVSLHIALIQCITLHHCILCRVQRFGLCSTTIVNETRNNAFNNTSSNDRVGVFVLQPFSCFVYFIQMINGWSLNIIDAEGFIGWNLKGDQ